jgi:MarR family transcriptional regulator, temperature-dependent positive regulator of motility
MLNDEIHYRILRKLERNPTLSQRQLADSMSVSVSVSVGKAKYCMRALVERGLVKVENFRCSQNKLAYAYYLTPRGMASKARITRNFSSAGASSASCSEPRSQNWRRKLERRNNDV